MAAEGVHPMDERSKRTRDLLASFYASDPSSMAAAASPSVKIATLDSINHPSFDPEVYMNLLVQKSNMDGLLQRHVEMAAEIKNLDTDLQMLVYENYNKFISATDTIKRMKSNIVGMEANMEELIEKIISVQSRSDGVNTSLLEKKQNIEKLHCTRNLLRKVQFIYDLPLRLQKCIKTEAYGDAVRFFTGAKPIFEAYGNSSFQDCKQSSEEAMDLVIQNLQAKLYSDSEPIEARAEAVVLLNQLNFPVDDLKAKLLEKLEDYLQNKSQEVEPGGSEQYKMGKFRDLVSSEHADTNKDKDSVDEFSKTVRAYLIIFPDSERQLVKLAHDFFTKHFETVHQQIKKGISSADLLEMLRVIWEDVTVIDEVLQEAALPAYSLEALARLRFSAAVAQSDVDEALRLMQMSKFSLYSEDRQRSGLDAISDIYSILRDEAARTNSMDVSFAHAQNWITRKGYSEAQLKECLEEYATLNVWQIHPKTFDNHFIDA